MILVHVSSCLLLCNLFHACEGQESKCRLVVPEYICAGRGQGDQGITTIRIFGENASAHEWSLGFELDEKRNSQRQILMIWKNVRRLEEYFKSVPVSDKQRGLVVVNNTMFTSGIKYFINVSVSDEPKVEYQKNKFEYIADPNPKLFEASVSLFGPDVIYTDMTYLANAEITCCSNVTDYQVSWQLLDNSGKKLPLKSTKSRFLRLPPGLLVSGSKNGIRCTITDSENNKTRTSHTLWVDVLQRRPGLVPYVTNMTLAVKQRIHLKTYLNSDDGNALSIEWNCATSTNQQCVGFESCNCTELIIADGFSAAGSYIFTAHVSLKNITSSTAVTVNVIDGPVPLIEVENAIVDYNPKDSLQISTYVSGLVNPCVLRWSCVENATGFNHVELNVVPGDPGKIAVTNNSTLESELDDLNDESAGKQFDLIVPSPVNNSWQGLDGNAKYLFRITVRCESGPESAAHADVLVHTNAAPRIKALIVAPASGVALRTVFAWSMESAEDSSDDRPLLYKFGYINGKQRPVFLVRQYDHTNALSVLPHQGTPIQTVAEVCDSKGACSSTSGPKVIVEMPDDFTAREASSAVKGFNKMIFEQDYFNAFMLATMVAQTTKKAQRLDRYGDFKRMVENATKNEVRLLLRSPGTAWIDSADNLLRNVKLLDEEYHLPNDILQELLSLRDKLLENRSVRKNAPEKLRKHHGRQFEKSLERKKRIINDINLEEIRNYLEISELAIDRLNDSERVEAEKQVLRKKMNNYGQSVCLYLYNYYKTDVKLELDSFYFGVEKINLARRYNDYQLVPYDISRDDLVARILLGREVFEQFRTANGVCIGKTLFTRDYFNSSQHVYNVRLYSAEFESHLDTLTNGFTIIMIMPIKTRVAASEEYECIVMSDLIWDSSKCRRLRVTDSAVHCACNTVGYFSVRAAIADRSDKVHVPRATATPVAAPSGSPRPAGGDVKLNYRTADDNNVSIAVFSLIGIFSFGIVCSVVIGFVAYKKMRNRSAQMPSQSVIYGQYFDQHNLNDN